MRVCYVSLNNRCVVFLSDGTNEAIRKQHVYATQEAQHRTTEGKLIYFVVVVLDILVVPLIFRYNPDVKKPYFATLLSLAGVITSGMVMEASLYCSDQVREAHKQRFKKMIKWLVKREAGGKESVGEGGVLTRAQAVLRWLVFVVRCLIAWGFAYGLTVLAASSLGHSGRFDAE